LRLRSAIWHDPCCLGPFFDQAMYARWSYPGVRGVHRGPDAAPPMLVRRLPPWLLGTRASAPTTRRLWGPAIPGPLPSRPFRDPLAWKWPPCVHTSFEAGEGDRSGPRGTGSAPAPRSGASSALGTGSRQVRLAYSPAEVPWMNSPDRPSQPIRVVHYGLGPIGIGIARLVAERPALQAVGAIDVNPELAGRRLGDAARISNAPSDPMVGADAGSVLAASRGAVVIHCTGSSLERVLPQLLSAIEAGCHVVSTCEELSFPWTSQPELARRLDQAARAAGVAVLGTGVNPGFAMDYLPLVLSGVVRRIDSVTVHRVQDAGLRRLPLQRKG